MPLPKTETYTTEYIYSLPEGKRAELIDGVVYDMAPPNFKHQYLSSKLTSKINQYIDSKKGDCIVIAAPFAVFLNNDNKTYVEPDISVICDQNKLDDYGCNGAPDWIIEIVSPSSRRMDYFTKLISYRNAGVREYWIIDPAKEHSTIYQFEEDDAPMIFPFAQAVPVGIYEDFDITIAELLN